ncbi:MAG TPA: metallophosphoesterase [Chitinophagaceae bacterium]|jgi:hypothetical protein|nr:metallophosphoesterase [Chitinophagaceae bacterium]
MQHFLSGYDIIGDIHGHANELKALLKQLGYAERDLVWRHPERKVIFVGDYIDRGPAIRETLSIVKNMADAGTAHAIMGNHEYNALAFSYHSPRGGYIRPHTSKNIIQHYETIKQFQHYSNEWDDYLSWFSNLPLFLEIDGIRAIHACWDDENIRQLKTITLPFTKELLIEAHDTNNPTYKVFEETLKGKEIRLPDGHFFIDKDGNKRNEVRTRWWLKTEGLTLRQYLFHAPASVMELPVPDGNDVEGYGENEPAVFFGHYWLTPNDGIGWQASNVCCLDYSVAKGGNLVAYRHYFDQPFNNQNFVIVPSLI